MEVIAPGPSQPTISAGCYASALILLDWMNFAQLDFGPIGQSGTSVLSHRDRCRPAPRQLKLTPKIDSDPARYPKGQYKRPAISPRVPDHIP